jgi:hypothetical protein
VPATAENIGNQDTNNGILLWVATTKNTNTSDFHQPGLLHWQESELAQQIQAVVKP